MGGAPGRVATKRVHDVVGRQTVPCRIQPTLPTARNAMLHTPPIGAEDEV
jgi:hypothetical protein